MFIVNITRGGSSFSLMGILKLDKGIFYCSAASEKPTPGKCCFSKVSSFFERGGLNLPNHPLDPPLITVVGEGHYSISGGGGCNTYPHIILTLLGGLLKMSNLIRP